jgi:Zn-dependent protease with chaperone function
MTTKTWLVQRAALALVLMVSFYVFALAIAAFLLFIPYEAYTHDVRLPVKITLVCVVLAGTIVWSIVPRIDKFVPPGPTVTHRDAPELFAVLTDVAARTDQQMPAEVYLVNDVNAFVTERGGVMGIGSRRVMGIGMPLLQTVTVQELRAILAHEFGHYHAGDVKVGPWIYKTRAAIGRTIHQLSNSVLQKVFVWYGNLFLRITHAVSRQQEFIADAVAARVAGAPAMVSALRKVHGTAGIFHGYWNGEVAPVLNSGYLPPIGEGFAKLVSADTVKKTIAESIRAEEAEGQSNPFDTHPPLRERVAALNAAPDNATHDVRPAVSLLIDPDRWHRPLLSFVNAEWASSLKPLRWEEVLATIHVPMWRNLVKEHSRWVAGVTASTLPSSGQLSGSLVQHALAEDAQLAFVKVHVMAAALSLALIGAGWTASRTLGESTVFRRDGHELRPFEDVFAIATGKLSPDAWRERCALLGLDSLPLADVAPGPTTVLLVP